MITLNRIPAAPPRLGSLLGVASTLRRAKSKAPALRNISCKAGALLLARRSPETTPSRGLLEGWLPLPRVTPSASPAVMHNPALAGRSAVPFGRKCSFCAYGTEATKTKHDFCKITQVHD
jgi:hypothetical protein